MDVIIDPKWSFSQAFMVAVQAYPGDNIGMKGYRNVVLKAWASTVGRERAVRELAGYRALFPSKTAAAAAMGLSALTFRRLEAHFAKVRRLDKPGLTLGFDARLHRFDPTAFDAFIAQVLGPDTDVTIVERSSIGDEGPGFLRIHGSRTEDLVHVAVAFYDRSWRNVEAQDDPTALVQTMAAGFATLLGRLEIQRGRLASLEESLGILRDPDVVEMLEDQGTAFVLAKDKESLKTQLQRVSAGVAREVKRRTVGQLGELVQGEIAQVVSAELMLGDED